MPPITKSFIQTDVPDERYHRALIATMVNRLLQVRPPFDQTAAEIAAGVTPVDFAGSVRPWVDAALRYGLVADDATDNTLGFTNMVAVGGQCLWIKRGTYRTGRFTVRDDTTIFLEPGTIIRDIGVLGATDRLINITNDRIHIIGWGATIQGNRAAYTPGEQRHNVFIYEASDVCIEGLSSDGAAGDGFYIGGDTGDASVNVTLIGCKADDNRRQGLSIVNARRIRVIDFEGTNTNGTAPASGIDIEPNAATDVLEDIKIIRPRLIGNDGPGLEIFLANWNAIANYCDIDIIEPYTSDNGAVSQSGRLRPGIDLNRVTSTTPCRGRVRVIDAYCVDEFNAGIHVYDWDINGPRVEIIRPTIINPNQADAAVSTINGGIILHNTTTHTTTPGNVRIVEPTIRDDDAFLVDNSLAPIRISGIWDLVEIVDPNISYNGNPWSINDTAAEVRFSKLTPLTVALTVDTTLTDGRYLGRTITNAGASATATITLQAGATNRIGWRYRFEVAAAQELRIDPNGTDLIRGGTAGQYLVSSTIGDNVEIECDSATTWKIVSRYGTWAFV